MLLSTGTFLIRSHGRFVAEVSSPKVLTNDWEDMELFGFSSRKPRNWQITQRNNELIQLTNRSSTLTISAPINPTTPIVSFETFKQYVPKLMQTPDGKPPIIRQTALNQYHADYARENLALLRWDAEGRWLLYRKGVLLDCRYSVPDCASRADDVVEAVVIIGSIRSEAEERRTGERLARAR